MHLFSPRMAVALLLTPTSTTTTVCVKDQLETKVLNRDPMSYERESTMDGWDSAQVIRYTLPTSLDLSCPCASRYRICATVYDASMNPIYRMDCTPPRLDYPHTFVDLPAAGPAPFGRRYSALSFSTGRRTTSTLSCASSRARSAATDCSPVAKTTITMAVAAAAFAAAAGHRAIG